jgi:DNA-binding CsgD family transcriptional regulator
MDEVLERGRWAFARRAWVEAYDALSDADGVAPLAIEDLERLATAAYLLGHDDESADLLARAHRESLGAEDVGPAARAAIWLGLQLLDRGEEARAGGWLGRAHSVLADEPECAEHGLLLVPQVLGSLDDDPAGAYELSTRAETLGRRFADPDLEALGRLGRGEALIRLGDTDQGAALLDEAMVAVDAGEASPIVVGILYCAVIDACRAMFDLRRAQEWTEALREWCEAQPDLVPFRGQCLVYRSEILQLRGEWADAIQEAHRAQERLSHPPGQPAVGMALYRRGELHRRRGELAEAEEAYRLATDHGHDPEPGLALLRLAQGKLDGAVATIRRASGEVASDVERARLLGPAVEIWLAAGHVKEARGAADELATISGRFGMPALDGEAARADGLVRLAEGDPGGALPALRQALVAWRELAAPYEAARVRTLIGRACLELGDEETAQIELEAARKAFAELGARPDLAHVDALVGRTPTGPGGLTPREVEVLRLVAAGRTNRGIAADLVISERTVARHLSNIFTKLGLTNRAAATAYAYEHELV